MTARQNIKAKMQQNLLPIFTIFMLWFGLSSPSLIAQSTPNPYENVDSFQLFQTLEKPCSQYLQNVSLQTATSNIANAFDVSIWVDRRIDNSQPISVSTDEQDTLLSVLLKIADQSHSEIAYLNQIIYFAPKGKASTIDFAYWQLFKNSFDSRKLDNATEWSWNEVQNPSAIIQKRAKELSFNLANASMVEHDLWAPYSLPASNFAAQWTCVLSGFDITISSKDFDTASFKRLEEPVSVSFQYTQQQMLAIGKARFARWQSEWPGTRIKKSNSRDWTIDAPVAAHRNLVLLANTEAIANSSKQSSKANGKRPSSKKGESASIETSRFTLKVTGSVGNVLVAVKQQAALEITPWPLEPSVALKQISLDLKQATLDELLQAIAKEAGVEIDRNGKRLTVVGATPLR